MRIFVFMMIGGAVLAFYGFQEMQLGSVAKEEPQKISCEALVNSGPGDNAHIMLSDFLCCMGAYVYQEKQGSSRFDTVWVPVVPLGGEYHKLIQSMIDEEGNFKGDPPTPKNIKLILKTEHVNNEDALANLADQDTIQGLIVNEIESLKGEELKILQKSYPGIDFSEVYLLEHNRKLSGSGATYGSLGGGALLLLIGLGGLIARRNKG